MALQLYFGSFFVLVNMFFKKVAQFGGDFIQKRMEESSASRSLKRESVWTESIAAGSRRFVEENSRPG